MYINLSYMYTVKLSNITEDYIYIYISEQGLLGLVEEFRYRSVMCDRHRRWQFRQKLMVRAKGCGCSLPVRWVVGS